MAKQDYIQSSKVYVFEKKEIYLLFLFFIITALSAFVFGMRLGKKQLSIQKLPVESHLVNGDKLLVTKKETSTPGDVPKSTELDKNNKVKEASEAVVAEAFQDKSDKGVDEEAFQKLQAEFSKIQDEERKAKSTDNKQSNDKSTGKSHSNSILHGTENNHESIGESKQDVTQAVGETKSDGEIQVIEGSSEINGKMTIQIGAYKTKNEAIDFAKKFVARGYYPLVKASDIPGMGRWYRVSLGTFESRQSAQSYMKQEKTLFSTMKTSDYVINEIK